jgi:hypothetical protein
MARAKRAAPPEQLRFNYEALDSETREFVAERAVKIHQLARITATGIITIGQCLAETKRRLKHGQFLEWLKREFAWSDWTARSLMNVHERFKSENFSDLQIDVSALYLIAAPSTPEPVRLEVVRRAKSGEAIGKKEARAVKQEFEETGEIPAPAKSLSQVLEERRRREPVGLSGLAALEEERLRELDGAVRLIAGFQAPASDAWRGLHNLCAFDFNQNLNRALECLSRLQRARPAEAQ